MTAMICSSIQPSQQSSSIVHLSIFSLITSLNIIRESWTKRGDGNRSQDHRRPATRCQLQSTRLRGRDGSSGYPCRRGQVLQQQGSHISVDWRIFAEMDPGRCDLWTICGHVIVAASSDLFHHCRCSNTASTLSELASWIDICHYGNIKRSDSRFPPRVFTNTVQTSV